MVCVSATSMAEAPASVAVASALWEWEVSSGHYKSDRTYFQDLKDILELQPPGGNCLLIFLRVETPKGHIPFTPLDQLLLDIFHCPAIKNISY
jgi:hypothetical protein